ncbi:excinuclease ABC subunit C [Paramagnetospirillum kuznetsovii]|uniref:Excinuclease ABC subunit C n=1 Tax=Paramagnetospirillum kuznetsovii TaxID=2053833 RepID=A0A364NUB1_9PROT|nr:GIY-YIG nuclease family protein [Paramagnetospirillum kuznetsovii]RAU20656.1 excinuclease ABC subunit C [Paramagnetospirillum kuznetsovii]
MRDHTYTVYLLSSLSGVLYCGVTNNLERRIAEHRSGTADGFTKRYLVNRLVWFECSGDVRAAIAREKQIKGWKRCRKVALIETLNPDWRDLSKNSQSS